MNDLLFATNPKNLVEVRALCHQACQWPSKAARANLVAVSDDSHSNLGWNRTEHALVSHEFGETQRFQLGFSFSTGALIWLEDERVEDRLELDRIADADAKIWVDQHLAGAALQSTDNAVMPYDLDVVSTYTGFDERTRILGAWFEYGQTALKTLVEEFANSSIEPVAVRCWPHHFDVGALFVLEAGDPETSRSIGVGLSPGDGSYGEPYFYCTPWPVPDVATLSPPGDPLFWNTEGFVSLIALASRLDEHTNIDRVLKEAVSSAGAYLNG